MLVRIEAPHFVAGITLNERGVCLGAAPILKWCIGKRTEFLRDYFKRKGWKATVCSDGDMPTRCPKGTPKSNFECVPMKAALDNSVHCIRCGRYLGETN